MPPTGTITFYNNNVVIPGTVTYTSSTAPLVLSTLNASVPTVFANPGTYSITASYSGDANYSPSTTPVAQSLIVLGPVSINAATGFVIANPGAGGSSTFTVTPNAGFTGAATVSCTPDPAAKETTCTLINGTNSGSSLQVSIGGAGQSFTLNATTTAPHQLARQEPPSFTPRAPLVFACLLALVLPAFRRQRKYLLCTIAMALTLGLAACGGGSSGSGGGGGGSTDTGTATETYSFTITATTGSGATAFTTNSAVSITVE